MAIQIIIEYKLKNDENIHHAIIEPEFFFDFLEENETYENDGIARYSNEWEYLELNPQDLSWTDLLVLGTTKDYHIHTQYFLDGETTFSYRKNADGYEAIISCTQIHPGVFHILRLYKLTPKFWTINYNGLIETLPDGSQQETQFEKSTLPA